MPLPIGGALLEVGRYVKVNVGQLRELGALLLLFMASDELAVVNIEDDGVYLYLDGGVRLDKDQVSLLKELGLEPRVIDAPG